MGSDIKGAGREPRESISGDPTKDPAFQRVVETFLNTPPKPKEADAKKKAVSKADTSRRP